MISLQSADAVRRLGTWKGVYIVYNQDRHLLFSIFLFFLRPFPFFPSFFFSPDTRFTREFSYKCNILFFIVIFRSTFFLLFDVIFNIWGLIWKPLAAPWGLLWDLSGDSWAHLPLARSHFLHFVGPLSPILELQMASCPIYGSMLTSFGKFGAAFYHHFEFLLDSFLSFCVVSGSQFVLLKNLFS